jgi:ATP-dependent Lon protease
MSTAAADLSAMEKRVKDSTTPDKLKEQITLRLNQLAKIVESPSFLPEYDRLNGYIEWVVSLPWQTKTQDNLDLENARNILDKNHYGLGEIKDRILEYISVMKLKQQKGEERDIFRAPILCFVGLVGTGKTTIAISIAEALGRKFARIPFGGMGDSLELRGQSKMYSEAEPGKIIKALRIAQSRNPVILLDELDRVTEAGRSSIMGVLVELLDPEQNKSFVDHYIDFPIDLSEVLFIATSNNTTNISTAVLDRLEPIFMPSYTDIEKITIGIQYVLPRVMKNAGIPEGSLVVEESAWPKIVRPLGYDSGIRTLERNIEGVVRKVARSIIEGKGDKFVISAENVKDFIPQ